MPARLALPLAVLTLSASAAHAQSRHVAPPRACTNTAPASLTTTSRPPELSAVMGGDTLWVLYGDRDPRGHDTVTLMEVPHIAAGRSLAVNLHAVGEGQTTPGALAVVGDHVVAAFARPDHHVGVYLHPTDGSADVTHALDAPAQPTRLALSAVGTRALLGWDDDTAGVRFAWLDAHGTPSGAVRALAGHYGGPVVSPAFGGALFFSDASHPPARVSLLRATPSGRVVTARAAAAALDAAGLSTTMVGARPVLLSAAGGQAHLTLLTGAAGAGTDRALGTAAAGAETAVAATPWGAVAAWTDGGVVRVVPVNARGVPVSAPFALSDPASSERARMPSVVVAGDSAIVLWSGSRLPGHAGGGAAVRMVRLNCL